MNQTSVTPDFIGRCIDATIPLVLGIIGLLYYPYRVAKNVKSGKWSESEGKKKLIRVLIAYSLIALVGVLNMIRLFR
jgi:hypothetical protein